MLGDTDMRVLLVSMPFQTVGMPSLALGVLDSAVHRRLPELEVGQLYANILFAEHIVARGFPVKAYEELVSTTFRGIGEWIFSSALHDVPEWKFEEFRRDCQDFSGIDGALALELHHESPRFVDGIAERIVREGWDVVALTSTFMQNVASLSLARALKRRKPEIVTIAGGANLDGVQGEAIHARYRDLDYVVRGEGDTAFPDFLERLVSGENMSDVPGLCWREGAKQVCNPGGGTVAISDIPAPNFDPFFAQLDASPVGIAVQPQLVLEAARGCWWGEKHHCKFCGLNGSTMKFRSKSPAQVWEEIAEMVARHQVLDIVMVDNILDMRYFENLLPRMMAANWDLRIHYEVKANLNPDQLRILRLARITHIQPGIESLSTHVLALMDKGVSGCQNVALLREGENEGLTVSWNHLYGFPDETIDDYESIIRQIPALVHLQPPSGAQRIAIERFSPYFNQPELGFEEKKPAGFYSIVYGLSDEEVSDMVFFFDAPPRGIAVQTESDLKKVITSWQELHAGSHLYLEADGDAWVINDERRGWPQRRMRYETSFEREAISALLRPHSAQSLARALEEAGIAVAEREVMAFLEKLLAAGFVFEQEGKHVLIATRFDRSNIRMADVLAGVAA
jgi:ribosomal peptide maturation radical SAM protein 1